MSNAGNIHGHAVRFIVDAGNGVVVAEIAGCARDVLNDLADARGLCFGNVRRKRAYARLLLPDVMRVVWRSEAASADAEQTTEADAAGQPSEGAAFDAHTGAPIAQAWLERKYWRKYAARAGLVAEYLREAMAECEQAQEKWAKHAEGIDPLRAPDAAREETETERGGM